MNVCTYVLCMYVLYYVWPLYSKMANKNYLLSTMHPGYSHMYGVVECMLTTHTFINPT